MVSTLAAIIILGLLALFWLEAARARELAMGISRAACDKQRYQLLDDSVYLQRVGLRWTPSGLRFRRMYRFDYSMDGTLRQSGYILLIGNRLEAVHIQGRHTIEQEAQHDATPAAAKTVKPSAEVIPFPGKRQ
ncbi:DUF3301 domain-containing protein [Thiolapillus sp.]